MHGDEDDDPMSRPRSRAVFSTEDFRLLKLTVGEYLARNQDAPETTKLANLYHRLGRLS